MLRSIYCDLCEAFLGRDHGYKVASLKTKHFREKHAEAYEELREASKRLKDLRSRYKYHGHLL